MNPIDKEQKEVIKESIKRTIDMRPDLTEYQKAELKRRLDIAANQADCFLEYMKQFNM